MFKYVEQGQYELPTQTPTKCGVRTADGMLVIFVRILQYMVIVRTSLII